VNDPVNHPAHYNAHPGGIECIELVETLPFCEGNAIKYLWRADHKGARLTDLKKARWYAERALESKAALRLGRIVRNAPEAENVHRRAVLFRACDGFEDERVRAAIHWLAVAEHEIAIEAIDSLIAEAAL
jgi:hypothetical protein